MRSWFMDSQPKVAFQSVRVDGRDLLRWAAAGRNVSYLWNVSNDESALFAAAQRKGCAS